MEKERKSPPREKMEGFEREMLGRTCSVGVNSGVVEHTQCEILSLNVQGIVPVKE